MFGRRKREAEREAMRSLQQSSRVVRKIPEIISVCYTAAGNRKYQQDAVYVSPGGKLAGNRKTYTLAVVCDGMGGMADGGLASRTAISMMVQGFERLKGQPGIHIPTFFRQGIRIMDEKIHDFPKENGKGSGTTMVAVIAEDNRLYWASVGDSRIYILRGNVMRQITRDHNYELCLREMVNSGQISPEEARAQRQKEALISFLGIGNVSLMDVNDQAFELQFGDVVLLCSDGVTKTLGDEQIRDILQNDAKSMEEKAKILVEAAIRTNTYSQDNTSVAILQYVNAEIKKK